MFALFIVFGVLAGVACSTLAWTVLQAIVWGLAWALALVFHGLSRAANLVNRWIEDHRRVSFH